MPLAYLPFGTKHRRYSMTIISWDEDEILVECRLHLWTTKRARDSAPSFTHVQELGVLLKQVICERANKVKLRVKKIIATWGESQESEDIEQISFLIYAFEGDSYIHEVW